MRQTEVDQISARQPLPQRQLPPSFNMAPLTRSISYILPELSLEVPSLQSKDVEATSYPTENADLPRLVTFKSKSGSCSSCSNTSTQSCADCCIVFYCNEICQTAHWPEHKEICQDLKDQHCNEVKAAREMKALNQITEDLGKIISSDFKSLDYKDTKLSVKIDDSALFGDFYDVSEYSDVTRSFHPGTYKCTSVNLDKSCAPMTICHHVSVDPVKIMKQCILMSKDFFEHNDQPNQVTMPQWCNWESADEEYIPSDSESETSDSEPSESDLIFADFVGRIFDDKPAMESDSEDQDYDSFSETESESSTLDESEVSDHEFCYLIDEGKQYIRDVPQKRQSIAPAADMEVAEDGEDGEDSEAEAYKDFKEKVLESEHKYTSDIDDSDYLPYSDSDSDSGESIPERDISDSEKYISDNEVEVILESSKDLKDMDEEMYNEFLENMLDRFYIEESDAEDEDYTPANEDSSSSSEEDEISDSEENALLEESKNLINSLYGKRLSIQTEFYSSESDTESEVSSEEELYEDFIIHTEAKHDLSDTEDLEYFPEESGSEVSSSSSEDEMEISDAEFDAVLDDSKDDVKEVSGQKRKCHPSEDEAPQDSDNEVEMESDDALYNDFRTKLYINDPSKVEDLADSDDEEFVPPAGYQDSQDESQDSQDSQDESEDSQESQDEGSQASEKSMDVSVDEIKDLELSSDDELYEDFKDEVCKKQRKGVDQKSVSITPSDNKELIYFINSKYASSVKDSLENEIENGSEIAGSILLKKGSESFGIAVEMKGQTWRSAHVFEDSTSGKCFALVFCTDTLEHLSNNHEHLEAHYPDQKWSSVSETGLKFQMKEFFC